MQKSEIADSVSLLTGWSAIFDLYSANAEQREVVKRIRAGARHNTDASLLV